MAGLPGLTDRRSHDRLLHGIREMKTLKRWRPAITTAALLLSSGAWAASVQPVTVAGNFTDCSQLGVPGLVGGSSQTAPTDPQSYDLGNGQSITFDYNPDGQTDFVDFS